MLLFFWCLAIAAGLPQETISSVCPAITYKQEAFQDNSHYYVRISPDRPTDQFAFFDIHFELIDAGGVILEQANYPMIRYGNNREFLSEMISERMKAAVISGVNKVRYSFTYCLAASLSVDCNTGPYEFSIRPQGLWRANNVQCPTVCGLPATNLQASSRCVSSTGMELDALSCLGNPGTSIVNCPATMPCQLPPCQVGAWSDWSNFCSQKCGGGTKTRTRLVLNPGDNNCPTLTETVVCNTEPCRVPIPVPVPVNVPIQTPVSVPAPYEVKVPVPVPAPYEVKVPVPIPAPFEVQVTVPNPVRVPVRVPVAQQTGFVQSGFPFLAGGPAAAFQSWAPPAFGSGPGGPPLGFQSWAPPGGDFGGGIGGGGIGISPFSTGVSPFASSFGVSPFANANFGTSGSSFQSYGSAVNGQVAGYSPFNQQFGGVPTHLNSGAFVQGSGVPSGGWSSFEQATRDFPPLDNGGGIEQEPIGNGQQLLASNGAGQQVLSSTGTATGQQLLSSSRSGQQLLQSRSGAGNQILQGPSGGVGATQTGSFGFGSGPLGNGGPLGQGPASASG